MSRNLSDNEFKRAIMRALIIASENGYRDFLMALTPEELVHDLMLFDADFEKVSRRQFGLIREVAEQWQRKNRLN